MTPRAEPSRAPSTPRAPGAAAYGFAFRGLEAATVLAQRDGHEPPAIAVERRRLDPRELPPWPDDHFRIDADVAEFSLIGGGRLLIDRRERRATYHLPEKVPADDLAHPALALAAAVFARWAGMEAFHARAFVA